MHVTKSNLSMIEVCNPSSLTYTLLSFWWSSLKYSLHHIWEWPRVDGLVELESLGLVDELGYVKLESANYCKFGWFFLSFFCLNLGGEGGGWYVDFGGSRQDCCSWGSRQIDGNEMATKMLGICYVIWRIMFLIYICKYCVKCWGGDYKFIPQTYCTYIQYKSHSVKTDLLHTHGCSYCENKRLPRIISTGWVQLCTFNE